MSRRRRHSFGRGKKRIIDLLAFGVVTTVATMPQITIVHGIALSALGILGYFLTGKQSPTALIPTAFGILFVGLGLLAKRPGKRKMAMHLAAILALLGLLGTMRGIIKFGQWVGGVPLERPAAVISQGIMGALCALFLSLAIQSFIKARRAS